MGYLSAEKGSLNRIAHSAYIVVGILSEYRGKGIGTEFFRRLDIWAEEMKVSRLELTVICENSVAKHLYEKNGFEIERKSVLVDGKYLDEFYMAKSNKLETQSCHSISRDEPSRDFTDKRKFVEQIQNCTSIHLRIVRCSLLRRTKANILQKPTCGL